MGTNYYRIPKSEEIKQKKETLSEFVNNLGPTSIFNLLIIGTDPWLNFIDGIKVHLGKRSFGWKFIMVGFIYMVIIIHQII